MARKTSAEVFELVKSLSTSEKRYFTIFASLHTMGKENKYLTLFHLLEKAESYDEQAIITEMNEKGGVTFSKLKKYLYDLILKALRNYNAEKSGVLELNAAINDANVLFAKGLYQHAYKMIVKAEKTAEKYEIFSYNYLIENWKRRLQFHVDQNQVHNELSDKVSEYQQLDEYLAALSAFHLVERETSAISQPDAFPERVQRVLKQKVDAETPLKIVFFHRRIQSIAARLLQHNEDYLAYSMEAYEIAEKHPSLPQEDVLSYKLEPLMEYCNALLRNRQFGTYTRMLRKAQPYVMASKMQLNRKAKADIEAKMQLMQSEYDRQNGKMQNKQQHLDAIEAVLQTIPQMPSNAMRTLYYWEMISWECADKQFEKALNHVLEMEKNLAVLQSPEAIKCVKWICWYELGMDDDLNLGLLSSKPVSFLEKSVKKALLAELATSSINHFIQLKNNLKVLPANEKVHTKYFDFLAWCNDKLLGEDHYTAPKKHLHYYHL